MIDRQHYQECQTDNTDDIARLGRLLADRYTIEGEIGRGGMAVVYRATDLRHSRTVAIKVLLADLAASLAAERFVREIGTAAKLSHPHILPVFDSGETDGLLYYVMPFVAGESLRDRLTREGRLRLDTALAIVTEIADGLDYAHRQGVIHRDIKPENILLREGHAVLADFGIARAVSAAAGASLTATGLAIGTPLYMSPEQAMGGSVDGRADIYSLACTLYEMLAGEPPFTGPTPQTVIGKHLSQQPPLDTLRPKLPAALSAAMAKALAKDPADRYGGAMEFAGALSTAAHGPVPANRAKRAGMTVAVLLAMAALGIWTGARMSRARSKATGVVRNPSHVAVLSLEDTSPDAHLRAVAAGISSELGQILRSSPELTVLAEEATAQVEATAAEPLAVARDLDVGTLVYGAVSANAQDLTVSLRIVDGNTGAVVDSVSRSAPRTRLFTLGAVLAEQTQRMLEARLRYPVRLASTTEFGVTSHLDAWELVQDALLQLRTMTFADTAALGKSRHADSLLARAEALDPQWIRPPTLRARTDYIASRSMGDDPAGADVWIGKGLAHADRALALDSLSADALEVRGTLRYWRYLLNLAGTPAAAQTLLASARRDLEAAVRLNPSQAGAWGALSHLYYQRQSLAGDPYTAARRAYETNPFLPNAAIILARLINGAYDTGRFSDASHWCVRGMERFGSDPRIAGCPLLVMTMPDATPEVSRAWRLLDSTLAVTPAVDRDYGRRYAQLLVAVVLSRAGLRDSARATVRRALAGNLDEVDPAHELSQVAAFGYRVLGDTVEALRQLGDFVASHPDRAPALGDGWWFRPLAANPEFRRLISSKTR